MDMAKRIGDLFRKTERKLRNQEADAKPVRKNSPPKKSQQISHDNKENNVMTYFEEAEQGNTRSYAMRRLKKSRPDLHAKCLSGELAAHAAMIQAGYRKKPPSRKNSIIA